MEHFEHVYNEAHLPVAMANLVSSIPTHSTLSQLKLV